MKKQALVLGGVALVIAVAGYFSYTQKTPKQSGEPLNTEEVVAAPEGESATSTPVAITQDMSVRTPTGASYVKLPNLSRPIVAYVKIPPQVEETAKKEIPRLTLELQGNPELITSWLTLGIYRKVLGDYKGAEEIWLYVTKKWPSQYVAFNNLGDLYKEYLKDYPKSEKAFRAVIAKNPGYIPGYANLSDLYRYFYKEKATEAPIVLEQGLKANPQSIDLMLRLARYYGDTKLDVEKAKGYYTLAIQESERISETAFAAKIKAEMEEVGE